MLYSTTLRTIDKLPVWKRIVFLLTTLLLVWLLWQRFLWTPLKGAYGKIDHDIAVANAEIAGYQKSLGLLTEGLKNIQTKVNTGPAALVKIVRHSVNINEIQKVLKDILFAQHDLALLELEIFPVDSTASVVPPDLANSGLQPRTLVLKFGGEYFATLNYLKSLEKLSWLLFFDKLDYQVTNYPQAEVTIQMHILTKKEEL